MAEIEFQHRRYHVRILGTPQCSEEESTRHFYDYWTDEANLLFRRWEEKNPGHGLDLAGIHQKKEQLFYQNHSSGCIELISFS